MYPTEVNLQSYIEAMGLTAPPSARLSAALAQAVRQWESATGWAPFLKDSVDRTVYFDPPRVGSFGCILSLDRGLLSLTSVKVGVEADRTGGTTVTQGVDFLMLPADGGTDEKPWTDIQFLTNLPYFLPQSVQVVGKFGYATACPSDASEAILAYATAKLMPVIQGGNGPLKRVKQGGIEEEYSTEAGCDAGSQLMQFWADAVADRRGPWL